LFFFCFFFFYYYYYYYFFFLAYNLFNNLELITSIKLLISEFSLESYFNDLFLEDDGKIFYFILFNLYFNI